MVQSKSFEDINERVVFSEKDLIDNIYIKNFSENIRKSKKGYGYWSWKPYLVKKYFDEIKDNDILIYLDAGCEINSKGKKRFKQYIEQVNAYDFLFFEMQHHYYKWTKNINLFELEKFKYNKLIVAGCFMLKKNQKTKYFVEEWLQICTYNHGEPLADPLEIEIQHPEFNAHRHDLSALSLTVYKNDCYRIKDETWNQYWYKLKDMPFLAMRTRDGFTQLSEINKYYLLKQTRNYIKFYFRKILSTLKFLIVQRIYGFEIDCKPSFRNKEEIEWFIESIKNCNFYLEFGSGGTTFVAAQEHKKFISI
jgi:hypothetical protein